MSKKVELKDKEKLKEIKNKKAKYILEFDSFKLELREDTMLDFSFKEGESYSKEYLKDVLDTDTKYEIKSYLGKLISKKMYSEYDLREKVFKKYKNISLVNQVIKEFKDSNLINDEVFTKTAVLYLNSLYYGKYQIINHLRQRKVDSKYIDLIEFNEEDEIKKAHKYFNNIKNKYVSNNLVKQKLKIYDAMIKRGFSNEIAKSIADGLTVDEEKEQKALNRDYLKARKKFIDKGKLDYGITNKLISYLVQKGYTYDDVVKKIEKEEYHND